jgi:hypothetical protein
MKTKVTLLAIALATLASVALAQQTPKMSVANKAVEKPGLQVTTPLDWSQPVVNQPTTINRVGNISSRPWSQIVGWHNGAPFTTDCVTHEPQFCLLSVGR